MSHWGRWGHVVETETMDSGCLAPVKAGQVHSRFWRMEQKSRSCGDAWRAFIRGWAIHARCKLPVPQPGAPTPLLQTKLVGSQDIVHHGEILHVRAHSVLWEPFLGPGLKARRTQLILVPQTPGGGSQSASVYPPVGWLPSRSWGHNQHSAESRVRGAQSLFPPLLSSNLPWVPLTDPQQQERPRHLSHGRSLPCVKKEERERERGRKKERTREGQRKSRPAESDLY